jgi:hypothetical protein
VYLRVNRSIYKPCPLCYNPLSHKKLEMAQEASTVLNTAGQEANPQEFDEKLSAKERHRVEDLSAEESFHA